MTGSEGSPPSVAFDWTEFESPSAAVVAHVAGVAGTEPTAMEPLYEAIDPDALDSLLAPTAGRQRASIGSVEFTYCGCRIVVHADGSGYVFERGQCRSVNTDASGSASGTVED